MIGKAKVIVRAEKKCFAAVDGNPARLGSFEPAHLSGKVLLFAAYSSSSANVNGGKTFLPFVGLLPFIFTILHERLSTSHNPRLTISDTSVLLLTNSITVTSGLARTRIGGPQVPVPLLTYREEFCGYVEKPALTGIEKVCHQIKGKNLALMHMSGQLQVKQSNAIRLHLRPMFEENGISVMRQP